jgi:hypothetical protein
VQVIEVAVWLPTTGQFTPSIVTVAPVAPKFAPVITMFVPPAVRPELGATVEIDGRIEEVKLSVVKFRPPMVHGTIHRPGPEYAVCWKTEVTATVAPAAIVPERLAELLPPETAMLKLVAPMVTLCEPVPDIEMEQLRFSAAPEVLV